MARIQRPNLMIKVPATEPGLVAIRTLIGKGVSVNVTLIFGIGQYENVANAYIDGLEVAAKEGRDLSRIASVASFFVSRLDSAIDKQLDGRTHLRNLFICGTDQGLVGIIGSITSGIAMANRHCLREDAARAQ